MFELIPNLPSNEEISFKLTQNCIPSFAHTSTALIPLQSSLEYTHSRVSIQNILEQNVSIEKIETSLFSKNSSFKGSSGHTTVQSSLKHTPRPSFRERIVSNREDGSKKNIDRRLSFQLFEFQQQKSSIRNSLIHISERKKSWSCRENQSRSSKKRQFKIEPVIKIKQNNFSNLKKNDDEETILFNLKKSMHVKQIKLRADEERERNYLKKILQTRISNIHVNESISQSTPLWISRKTINRF